jgi:hypothetical protein
MVGGVRVAVLDAEELAAAGVTRERHAGMDGAGVLGAHRGLLGHGVRSTHKHREVSQVQLICSHTYYTTCFRRYRVHSHAMSACDKHAEAYRYKSLSLQRLPVRRCFSPPLKQWNPHPDAWPEQALR